MGLVKCPNCGKEISDKAFKCLYCDFKIENNDVIDIAENITQRSFPLITKNTKKLNYERIGKISIAIALVIWIIGFIKLHGSDYLIYSATYFIGLAVIGASLIISGVLLVIYGELKKSK